MKNVCIVVLLLAVMSTFGCVSSADSAAGVISVKDGSEKNTDEVKSELNEVPYLQKETNYFSDGYVESYKTYAYNEEMTPMREDTYNSFDENIESVVYEKVSKSEVIRSIYDERGTLYASKSCDFDESGNRISEKTFSVNGELQSVSLYSYNSKEQKTGWKVLDGDDFLLSETKYIYEDNLNTRIEIYDISGALVEYFIQDYKDNKLTLSSHYVDSQLKSTVEYFYENDLLITEVYKRASGELIRSMKYSYDSRNNLVKTEYFDSNNTIKGWSELEYIYFSQKDNNK